MSPSANCGHAAWTIRDIAASTVSGPLADNEPGGDILRRMTPLAVGPSERGSSSVSMRRRMPSGAAGQHHTVRLDKMISGRSPCALRMGNTSLRDQQLELAQLAQMGGTFRQINGLGKKSPLHLV
jgi:hypothetical protein